MNEEQGVPARLQICALVKHPSPGALATCSVDAVADMHGAVFVDTEANKLNNHDTIVKFGSKICVEAVRAITIAEHNPDSAKEAAESTSARETRDDSAGARETGDHYTSAR